MSIQDPQSVSEANLSTSRPGLETRNANQESNSQNPLQLLASRLHGRWKYAFVVGAVLSCVLGLAGYWLAPVNYQSSSVLVVEASLSPLVEETIETEDISQFSAFVQEKAQQVRDMQVMLTAFDDPGLEEFKEARPAFRETIFENISVRTPRGSSLVIVSLDDRDPRFAAASVNAVVDSYRKIFAPNPAVVHQGRVNQVDSLITASRTKMSQLKLALNEISSNVRYGHSDLASTIEQNIEQIQLLSLRVEQTDERMREIREQYGTEARIKAAEENRTLDPEELEPTASTKVSPTFSDLVAVDPSLAGFDDDVIEGRINFEVTARRFGENHPTYKRAKSSYESILANYEGRVEAARIEWDRAQGNSATWGGLQEKRVSLTQQLEELVETNTALEKVKIEAEDLNLRIAAEEKELSKLESRRLNLEREKSTVRDGRVRFPPTKAVPAFVPSSDKRVEAAAGGFVAGWFVSLGFFFLIGTMDQKTFGVVQLKSGDSRLAVLGVLPDMDQVSADGSTISLASDCIHRVRGRIEVRRAPEAGYAIMVSSPFQGDGKTTLAVSLGWSYAESGYRTLLIDADFIGRAMTHQFGRLKEPGLREVVCSGELGDEIVELGHPKLKFLGVGFDRRITAANLSPRLFARVLDEVRSEYDVIIVDSGPLTASIEAFPIASAVDGVILALRRGRSRVRLAECRDDVRAVGADYLGVVLNYADRSDCERYGSTSRVSEDVANSIGDSPESRNPLLTELKADRD